jgi:recombination protein RecA
MIGQGRESSKEYLRSHPELALEIDNLIRQKVGLPPRLNAQISAQTPNGATAEAAVSAG